MCIRDRACTILTAAAQEAPFITRPEETQAAELQPYLQYVLEDSMVSFVSVSDARGKALGSIAIEVGPAGQPSKLTELGRYFRTPTHLARARPSGVRNAGNLPASFPEGNGAPTDCETSWPGFPNEVLSY